MIKRHVYRKVRTIIQRNPHLHKPRSFYDFMGATFAAFAVIAVRRQREAMKLLLSSIEKNPQILSRERFVEIFTTKILAGRKPTRPRGPSGGGAYIPSVAKFQIMASKTLTTTPGPMLRTSIRLMFMPIWRTCGKKQRSWKSLPIRNSPPDRSADGTPYTTRARCLHLDL